MAGWNLKESILEEEFLTPKELNDLISKVISSKKQNSYKYFLLISIFHFAREEALEVDGTDVILYIVKLYQKLLVNYLPNIKEEKSLLYQEIKKLNFNFIEKNNINEKKYNFLYNYVFGALAIDTNKKIFGFSKITKKIIINKNLKYSLTQEMISFIEKNLKNEFFSKKRKEREK